MTQLIVRVGRYETRVKGRVSVRILDHRGGSNGGCMRANDRRPSIGAFDRGDACIQKGGPYT